MPNEEFYVVFDSRTGTSKYLMTVYCMKDEIKPIATDIAKENSVPHKNLIVLTVPNTENNWNALVEM